MTVVGVRGDESAKATVDAGPGAARAQVEEFRVWLAGAHEAVVDDAERVELIAELERVKGAAAAAQARLTDDLRLSRESAAAEGRDAAVASGEGAGGRRARAGGSVRVRLAVRSVGSEVALARRESPSCGDRFVGVARALVHELPHVMAALTAGVIGERHVLEVVRATACLSQRDRMDVDRRLAAVLGSVGWRSLARAAAKVAAELDAASVVRRMEAAVRSRRVWVRPAPDGMAYLSVLGTLKDVVGAHAALQVRAKAVVGGQCPEEPPEGRGVGAVAADTALRLLSGRSTGDTQPVEVQLVITDRALLGDGDRARSPWEAARGPGHGSVPAPAARWWLRDGSPGSVFVRRLYASPDGRDL
ncbi:MAG: DUF222 domain-containing protein, partial [Dermatophilaceae bacterium]